MDISKIDRATLAKCIDHTLLKPEASLEQVESLCKEAIENKFASVCVNPSYIEYVAERLLGTGIAPCCVIGFPLGATLSEVKAFEAKTAVKKGAAEVDMVVNVGAIKSNNWGLVYDDIFAVVKAVKYKALVKVIIETCLLTDEEKVKACQTAKSAGADFVKTSTGFSTGGAKVEDVRLMRNTVGDKMGVKASGSIRDYETAIAMLEAGASRLGTSSGIKIINGLNK